MQNNTIIKKKKPNGYWTEERIFEELKNYETLDEFRKNEQGAYDAARRLRLLDKLRENINFHFQPNGYWNKEKCYKEAQKYKTKIEFKNQSPSAYAASVKNKWIDEFTWIVSNRNPNYGKSYTIDELSLIAEQCYNRTELKTKFYHAYIFAKKNNLLDILNYNSFSRKENHIKKNKYVFKPKKYTYHNLYEIAKKYKTLKDFTLNENSAYATASHRGWLKDYTWLEKERTYYNEELCREIAKKCRNKTEYFKLCQGAYTFSLKNNLLSTYDWFENIKSTLERDIEDFLILNDINYITQKKFDWLKYKRHQKLDFYLPDYNIAIECQGEQHFYEKSYFNRRGKSFSLDENKKRLCNEHGITILYYSNLGIEYPYQVYEDKNELLKVIKSYSCNN